MAFGTARPAMTLSPVGSTLTTSKDGTTASRADTRADAGGVGGAPGAGVGRAGGADGSTRRASSADGAPVSPRAGGPTTFAAASGPVPAGGRTRCGSKIPNQITAAARAATPKRAVAIRPGREMAILVHTFGNGAPGTFGHSTPFVL